MKIPKLLTRDEFRNFCLERDKYSCVVCKSTLDLSVHHIVERRLWSDGGYYIENGATLCDPCHYKAEQTLISCDELREICKIEIVHLPSHFYKEEKIDKWGNYILSSGNRLKGELYFDESVQKVIEPVKHLFTKYVKYGRTFHVPWSPGGKDKNERVMPSMDHFKGMRVVVTEKMDGENTSMYNDYIHARSIDPLESHPSRSRIKALWSTICANIPENWRLSVENLFAKHSIHYNNLPDYALMFGIWDDRNNCKSWEETKEWAELLDLKTVPVLYEGIYDEQLIKTLYKPVRDGNESEGYVIRLADSLPYGEFRRWVVKYVGQKFCEKLASGSNHNWKAAQVIPNGVKK